MKKIIIFLQLFVLISLLKAQWQPDVRLTNNNAPSSTSFNNAWCIASSGNNVHVVWFDNRDGDWEIYYKRSTDNGLNWGVDVRLTYNVSNSTYPSIAVSGSVVHVVWVDDRDMFGKLYYKRSTDGGTNWGVDTRLSEDSSIVNSPSICVSGSNVHIAWNDSHNGYQVYYKRSTDGGTSWGPDIRLTNSPGFASTPTISVSGSVIHIAWSDNRNGDGGEIYYKRSTDNGITWGTDTRLTYAPSYSWQPSISVSGLLVNVVWADHRNGFPNAEIYYKRSSDGGLNWSDDIRLTNNLTRSWYPSVSASGSKIHVVWSDSCDVNYEIFYKRSTDGGLNWESDTRLTNDPSYSGSPSVSVNSSTVHVVWYDMRDGNGEIYYKRNPTGNLNGYFSISGLVKYSDNNQPVTNGLVKAIKLDKNTGNIIVIDSTQIQTDGSYILSNVPQDSLDIGIYPNSTPPNDWVITYYPSTTYWQQATTLYPTGNLTNINIGAIRMSPTNNSNSVNGKVMRLTFNPFGNLKDAVLYAKNGNTFVGCAVTDGNGIYHMPSLPVGNLKIIVDRLGFTGDSTNRTLTATSNIDSVNFYLNRVYVGIKQVSEIVPSEYKLYQNYPNPFNPSTNIRYQIAFCSGSSTNSKLVTLRIYDVLGKEITTLVNEKQLPGVYEVSFDASGLPSGIYFYKLMAGDFVQVKKMILIK